VAGRVRLFPLIPTAVQKSDIGNRRSASFRMPALSIKARTTKLGDDYPQEEPLIGFHSVPQRTQNLLPS
jgi:hypothetical protein